MKSFIRQFEKLPLIKKIIIFYAGVVILPLFILVVNLSKTEYEQLYSQTVNSKQLALEQLTQNIDTSMMSVEDLSQSLTYRSPISSLISRNHLDNFPIWTKRSSEETIEAMKYTLKYQNLGIKDISIYSNKSELSDNKNFFNESLLYEFEFYNNFESMQKDSDFYFLNEKDTSAYFKKKNKLSHEKEILLFVRNIQNEEEEINSGLLVFEINPEKFLVPLSHNKDSYGDYTIFFPNTHSCWGASLDDQLIMDIQTSSNKNRMQFSDVASGYLYSNIKDYNVIIVDEKNIDKGSYVILALRIFGIFFSLIIIQALGVRFLVKHILQKVNKSINEMDKIVENGFEGQINVDESDEFRYITRRYNILLHKIQTLISEMIKKETDKKEAQIKALQYQMNPHFIYNTLSIFASNAEESKNYKLADAISYFGHLLRYNIKNTGMFATIKEELDNAYSLIHVYSIRCRENLELILDVPQELYCVKIIKYLLQPILENAILHGGKGEKRSMTIKISISYCKKYLKIIIEDDGLGIEKGYLSRIKNNIMAGQELEGPSSGSSFIGLRNIYKRLQLMYGEESELLIDSLYGRGTTITIKIPTDTANGNRRSIEGSSERNGL